MDFSGCHGIQRISSDEHIFNSQSMPVHAKRKFPGAKSQSSVKHWVLPEIVEINNRKNKNCNRRDSDNFPIEMKYCVRVRYRHIAVPRAWANISFSYLYLVEAYHALIHMNLKSSFAASERHEGMCAWRIAHCSMYHRNCCVCGYFTRHRTCHPCVHSISHLQVSERWIFRSAKKPKFKRKEKTIKLSHCWKFYGENMNFMRMHCEQQINK